MRDSRAAVSWIIVIVVPISIRFRMSNGIRYRDILRNGDGVYLRRVAVVHWRLIVRIVVSSIRGGMVVVRRVVVVGVVIVWIVTSRGVGD